LESLTMRLFFFFLKFVGWFRQGLSIRDSCAFLCARAGGLASADHPTT
jgi:hypothetical protein